MEEGRTPGSNAAPRPRKRGSGSGEKRRLRWGWDNDRRPAAHSASGCSPAVRLRRRGAGEQGGGREEAETHREIMGRSGGLTGGEDPGEEGVAGAVLRWRSGGGGGCRDGGLEVLVWEDFGSE
ncbi:hypothetical protein OsI_22049 [Oryza sativa Indica Group]|jgi:hypothetical protein|uniref:Uncharacterized protein n=2 Tax=Oryza sativa TaxID=4530 RepID=B9FS02_ORYSJ|nr:hypothetical protein OsI_22049 [Oryza sativa Indica Group]EEE65263.1 hypothetical protein OsJ_20468 [Oryza sativa Japonica Group]KAF2925667.1 hypothetical protein DAI22_06g069700 [Oryza sativa Japonica Group]